jgi:hypothetical protein
VSRLARSGLLTVLLFLTLGGGSSAAAATTKAQGWQTALRFLNEQRRANGIPPVKDYQPFATSWCPNEGAPFTAGELFREWSSANFWARGASPWDDAPLHQQGQYDPAYTKIGYEADPSSACLGGGDPAPTPSQPRFYAYVSDLGPKAVPTSEAIPDELPFSPEQVAGIKAKLTGPVLIAYALGLPGEQMLSLPASVSVASVSVTTAATGSTVPDVHLVDAQTIDRWRGGKDKESSTDGVAFLVTPVLRPATRYAVRVTWRDEAKQEFTQQLTFETTAKPTTEIEDGL